MGKVEIGFAKGKPIYVGIDVHKKDWAVTALCQGEEVYHAVIGSDPGALIKVLKRFEASEVHTVYEAGPTGYWLHDALEEAGFDSMVTPPSLVPQVGGRVKTDRRDSRKLASMLAGGFLRRVYVLTPEERAHRQLLRTRNQIEHHRRQVQNQIKSMLLFHGKTAPETQKERWSEGRVEWIESIEWEYPVMKTAMAILVEVQNIDRFRRADQFASYLGLTPSQHSSGEKIRMGHITRCGNYEVRTRLVESSWTLIRYDAQTRVTYERIKHQTGSGRKAITAIARRLSLRVRRVLIDREPYRLVAGGHLATGKDKRREVKRYLLRTV